MAFFAFRSRSALTLFLFMIVARAAAKKVSVEIFYETQCPYSLDFLNTTLRSAWADPNLWQQLNVTLIPFGNAKLYQSNQLSPGFHFWHPNKIYPVIMCQHATTECLGNKIQSCAMKLLQETQYVPFVICMASYGTHSGIELTSYACGQKLGINMPSIRACADSGTGHNLSLVAGSATKTASVTAVPWVVVNGKHTHGGSLLTPVCNALKESNVAVTACQASSGSGGNSTTGAKKKKKSCGGSGSFLSRRTHIEKS